MLPLDGIKVVEIAQNLAGPYAGEILGMLGADVLKIERPDGGDDARGWGPPFHGGLATTFHAVNRGKRSVALDLKRAEDVAWLKARVAESDVLVQNMRPGLLEAIGLGPDVLCAANPRLVYTSLWAMGATGPMRLAPGYEPMVQAFSGMFSLNGAPEGPPSRVGMQVLDLGSGLWAALGTVAALFRRQATGKGGVVDTSLLETALGWMAVHFAGFSATGALPPRDRTGNPKVVVFSALATADGELVVAAANDRLFARLAAELGHPEWGEDPRYATNAARVAVRDEILGLIQEVTRTRPSAHWSARFAALGIPCAPINDMSALLADPQVAALGMIEAPPGTDLRLIGLPLSFDGARPRARSSAPHLGERVSGGGDLRP
jgi:crotonobetainyl-CoA:carnitine CoA-transferase CaiB-like acyl-CoA transferase